MSKITIQSLIFAALVIGFIIGNQKTVEAQPQVIDKIVAVVGSNEILYSDVQNQYMQYLMQGYSADGMAMRCQIFEEMLFTKLLLNQAQLDSIVVSEDQVGSELDRRLQYFISQIGSQEKLEAYYNRSINDIKADLRNVIRDQMMSEQVREKIVADIKITPAEVRVFYNEMPKDSIPSISSEYQYSHIVITPTVHPEERQYALSKMESIRQRVIKGESFESLARLYSEDPGSAMKGGELGDFGKGVMYPEFEAAAFTLQEGEISPIVESEAGFHIIKLIKRKGDYINVRHILIMTKVSPISIQLSQNKLDSVYLLISSGKITFEEAALKYSDDDSKYSKGAVVNQQSGNTIFLPEQMDKDLFFTIDKMSPGQISKPSVYEKDRNTKAIRIVRLDKRTQPHVANLEEDYDKIQSWAIEDKKSKALNAWINDKASKTYIFIQDADLKNCDFIYKWD
jgi:peptidyl-prolyl cis-trans isomerase SurA